ncbi:hypothetical protein PSHT_16574 [Puccinia striiformis]|uniref:Uncharacterized protein n=1 Tax=Puccinia striiformis TaxID=27350 RepID=A0A2S4U9D6_9BASI|nr:hypothetical protein PSHT_16574 [Puccinia striiformis]
MRPFWLSISLARSPRQRDRTASTPCSNLSDDLHFIGQDNPPRSSVRLSNASLRGFAITVALDVGRPVMPIAHGLLQEARPEQPIAQLSKSIVSQRLQPNQPFCRRSVLAHVPHAFASSGRLGTNSTSLPHHGIVSACPSHLINVRTDGSSMILEGNLFTPKAALQNDKNRKNANTSFSLAHCLAYAIYPMCYMAYQSQTTAGSIPHTTVTSGERFGRCHSRKL